MMEGHGLGDEHNVSDDEALSVQTLSCALFLRPRGGYSRSPISIRSWAAVSSRGEAGFVCFAERNWIAHTSISTLTEHKDEAEQLELGIPAHRTR
jgi:hypothetical protein